MLVSLLVTAAYIGFFQLLKMLGFQELFAILMILNDPALIGFLFIGITILFERDSGTLDALKVTPFKLHEYLWAKLLVLGILGTACAWPMAIALLGVNIEHAEFLLSAILIALFFGNLGILFVSISKRFLDFTLHLAWILVLNVFPMFEWFGLFKIPFKAIFPLEHGIRIMAYSFHYQIDAFPWLSLLVLSSTVIATYLAAAYVFQNKLATK